MVPHSQSQMSNTVPQPGKKKTRESTKSRQENHEAKWESSQRREGGFQITGHRRNVESSHHDQECDQEATEEVYDIQNGGFPRPVVQLQRHVGQ